MIIYRVHRCGVAEPCIVHLLDVSCACAIEERLGGGRVVAFDARSGDEISGELRIEKFIN